MTLESAELLAFVPVRDVGRARAFYEGTLGCVVEVADEYGCALRWRDRPLRLARVEEPSPPAFTVLGWLVPSMEDAVRTLTAAGVAFRRFEGMVQDDLGIWTAPSGGRVAWFSDSEGNTLSLTQSA